MEERLRKVEQSSESTKMEVHNMKSELSKLVKAIEGFGKNLEILTKIQQDQAVFHNQYANDKEKVLKSQDTLFIRYDELNKDMKIVKEDHVTVVKLRDSFWGVLKWAISLLGLGIISLLGGITIYAIKNGVLG